MSAIRRDFCTHFSGFHHPGTIYHSEIKHTSLETASNRGFGNNVQHCVQTLLTLDIMCHFVFTIDRKERIFFFHSHGLDLSILYYEQVY